MRKPYGHCGTFHLTFNELSIPRLRRISHAAAIFLEGRARRFRTCPDIGTAYFPTMSAQEIETAVMALPLSERVSLAQALWQSIDAGFADSDEREAVREVIRRDHELSSGAVVGRTREEIMQSAANHVRQFRRL
ncbi:MAG: addiction module protein [Chthoniobacteraceae bacterium]